MDCLPFNGMIIYFLKDDFENIHMVRRKSVARASLEKYKEHIGLLKQQWKDQFVKAFVLNLESAIPVYMWSTHNKIVEQNEGISRNHQRYIEFLKENRDEISLIGVYKSMRTRGMHLCKSGHEWFVQPIKVQQGEKCPLCENDKLFESHGVKYITKLLVENDVEFVKEICVDRFGIPRKQFLDFLICKDQYPLFVIEFNGVQHYRPQKSKHFGGYKNFKVVKQNDWIKRKSCWKIGLPIIDIPYTESDSQIQTTIDYFLRLFKLKE